MENKGLTSPQDLQIQGLLDRYLRLKNSADNAFVRGEHLDDDCLTAFTEGSLTEREAQPIISHLVDCSFCRHMTTELVRLDLVFAADKGVQTSVAENQPSKVSDVLSNLLSRIFGTADSAVFAHEEKEETQDETADLKDQEK